MGHKILDFRDVGTTQDELAEFLAGLEQHLRNAPQPAPAHTLRLLMALSECKVNNSSDDFADSIARGLRLGLCLAAAEPGSLYREQFRRNRKAGQSTRSQNLNKRNLEMRDRYDKLEPAMGDLPARQQLRKDYDLTLRQINNIVKPKSE